MDATDLKASLIIKWIDSNIIEFPEAVIWFVLLGCSSKTEHDSKFVEYTGQSQRPISNFPFAYLLPLCVVAATSFTSFLASYNMG